MGRIRKYNTEEERKAAKREYNRRFKEKNPDYFPKYDAEYRQKNREKKNKIQIECSRKYRKTPEGRANYLLYNYKKEDNKYNRGECTLTADWIVENIFSKPCHYCGRTDWTKIGCDRIDNSLPHTPDNIVPCCSDCNRKKARYGYDDFFKMLEQTN